MIYIIESYFMKMIYWSLIIVVAIIIFQL